MYKADCFIYSIQLVIGKQCISMLGKIWVINSSFNLCHVNVSNAFLNDCILKFDGVVC